MRFSHFFLVLAVLATLSLPFAVAEPKRSLDKNTGADRGTQTDPEIHRNCATICMQAIQYGCLNYRSKMEDAMKGLSGASCAQSAWYTQCNQQCYKWCPAYVKALCKVLPNVGGCLPQKCFKKKA